VVSGVALATGGAASLWLTPQTPLPALLVVYLLIGIFLGTVNPSITNTASPECLSRWLAWPDRWPRLADKPGPPWG
jgi:hypothetical protein